MHEKKNAMEKKKPSNNNFPAIWNLIIRDAQTPHESQGYDGSSTHISRFCPDQSLMRQKMKMLSGLMWLAEGCWHKKKWKMLLNQDKRGNSLRLLAVLCAWPPEFSQVHWGESWNRLNTRFVRTSQCKKKKKKELATIILSAYCQRKGRRIFLSAFVHSF